MDPNRKDLNSGRALTLLRIWVADPVYFLLPNPDPAIQNRIRIPILAFFLTVKFSPVLHVEVFFNLKNLHTKKLGYIVEL